MTSTLRSDLLLALVAGSAALAGCHLFKGEFPDLPPEIAQQVVGQPVSGDPVTVHGVDLIEVLILALAALGLGPVARLLGLLKPVLRPVLRAVLGRKADSPVSPSPAPQPSTPGS